MAYTDTVGTSHKLGTGAAVLALEAGLALALVTGLAHTITPRTNDRVEATNIPLPKPSDPPPPEAPTPARENPSVIDRPDVLIKLPPTQTDTTFPELTKKAKTNIWIKNYLDKIKETKKEQEKR